MIEYYILWALVLSVVALLVLTIAFYSTRRYREDGLGWFVAAMVATFIWLGFVH